MQNRSLFSIFVFGICVAGAALSGMQAVAEETAQAPRLDKNGVPASDLAVAALAEERCGVSPGVRVFLADAAACGGQLPVGHPGTVVCLDLDDPEQPLLVTWDGWTGGHNQTSWCDPPIMPNAPGSCWWMRCAQIASCPPCPSYLYGDVNGDGFMSNLDALIIQAVHLRLVNCLPVDTNCDGLGPE